MQASKETARQALEKLIALSDALDFDLRTKHAYKILFLQDFLEVAVRRLPTQAAIDRDKARKSERPPRSVG